MIRRAGDEREKSMGEELRFHIYTELSGTKIKNEQRLKGSHNSWEKERAEAQHVKAETQYRKGQRNQINRKGETQEKRHKN